MYNKFAIFINNYTDVGYTVKLLDALVGNNSPNLTNNSGGSSTLGLQFHENIQNAVKQVINLYAEPKSLEVKKLDEEGIKEQLFDGLYKEIAENLSIEKASALTYEDVANHFIRNLYDPLCSDAKELSQKFNFDRS